MRGCSGQRLLRDLRGSGGLRGDRQVEGIQLVVDNGDIKIVVNPNVQVNFGPPTSKADCKKGGWEDFNTPRTFKNQGDCIQFVNTGK